MRSRSRPARSSSAIDRSEGSLLKVAHQQNVAVPALLEEFHRRRGVAELEEFPPGVFEVVVHKSAAVVGESDTQGFALEAAEVDEKASG
jgi:hypothetical protein